MANILIVDDLSTNRQLLISILGEHGHRLREASDGSQALAAVQAEPPDLVITDVLMPVMDGYEFVRQLRLDPATSKIPVLFYTAPYGEREARERARESSVRYVLRKPAGAEEVLKVVSRVLAGQPEPEGAPDEALQAAAIDREHLRLLGYKLTEKSGDLQTANARLRALINIGLELASRRDSDRLLQSVCTDTCDLFGATYVSLGILDLASGAVRRFAECGTVGTGWIATGDPIPGILGAVVAERRTLRGDNPTGDPADLQLPPLHPRVQAFLAAPIASPAHVHGWICLVNNEGRNFAEDDAEQLMALAGQVGRIYEIEHEILERRQAEVALGRERDRAQRYLDTAEVILLSLDRSGRITLVNRYACGILGWTAEELLGRDYVETCIPARLRDATRQRLGNVLAGSDSSSIESPIVTKSGEERMIEWRNTLRRDDEGHVISTLSSGTDITERKRAEEEIRQRAQLTAQAEQEFRALFAANPLPMWIFDERTLRFLEVNDAAVEHYGYQRAEFLAMTIKDIRPPEDVAELLRHISTPRLPLDHAGNRRHRVKSGRLIEVDITSHTITFAGHACALVVAQDITKRKRSEEEIQRHAQLSALGAAVGLSLTGSDSLSHALQQCAEALVAHLGAAAARIWTLNVHAGVLELQASAGLPTEGNGPHGDIPLGQGTIGRIAQDNKPCLSNVDPCVAEPDWARGEGMAAFAGYPLIVNGRVVGVMALFAPNPWPDDVGAKLASVADHLALGIERHRGAEALRAAEARMRFALEAAGVGIWDQDFTTGALVWSETLETQYGLLPGAFEGTFEAFSERIHPDDRAAVLAIVGKAMAAGSDFTVEHRVVRPDGTIRWVSGMGRVQFGVDGKPMRAIGISLDLTERRSLEAQYQQAQKMEAIGRLAGGIAHDFNNLLTAILGYCELLLADLDPKDPRQADIAEIQKAGLSAAGLTRQLLAFSRKEIIEPKLLDLNGVVTGMRGLLGRLIGEDVRIALALRPGLAAVMADRGQVEQIVLNLALNSRDAMPKGGTLTIETANVELDENYPKTHLAAKPGLYVVLTVTDTGTGMTPAVQARLFEPFFTTKEHGKGTGLGLATVHGIVTRSGGTVNVYSELGKGSSFKVYFPRAGDSSLAVEGPPLLPLLHAGAQTVLVVEDAEGLRELTRRLLERQGYTVLLAANAEEAVRLFDENPSIDVLLTDVVMPGASGPELTRLLIERRPGLKVLYMSGYTEDTILHHEVLNPGIAFLHKPFTSETLGRKLREVLDQATV